MTLAIKLLKPFLLYGFVFILIVLLALLPRFYQVVPDDAVRGVMDFKYHLDWVQYKDNIIHYLSNFFHHGSLGKDKYGIPVGSVIAEYLPRSLLIIFTAFVISLPLGILKGIFDFRSDHKKIGAIGQLLTFFMLSLPDFFIIICVQWLLILYIPGIKFLAFGFGHWYSFLLPSILVAIYPIFYLARITSTAISNQMGEQYVQVARGAGFSERFVLYKHVLANCWRTILSHLSTVMLFILSNLLLVEYLMDYKGGAWRLFTAFRYSKEFRMGEKSQFEAGVVIGLALCFIMVILVVQLGSQIAAYYADPEHKTPFRPHRFLSGKDANSKKQDNDEGVKT